MTSVDDRSDVPISPVPGTSSNYGSPNGSFPDLDGMGHRSIDAQFKVLRDILLPLARGFADFENHVKTLSEAVGMVTSRITSVEQSVNAFSAQDGVVCSNGTERQHRYRRRQLSHCTHMQD